MTRAFFLFVGARRSLTAVGRALITVHRLFTEHHSRRANLRDGAGPGQNPHSRSPAPGSSAARHTPPTVCVTATVGGGLRPNSPVTTLPERVTLDLPADTPLAGLAHACQIAMIEQHGHTRGPVRQVEIAIPANPIRRSLIEPDELRALEGDTEPANTPPNNAAQIGTLATLDRLARHQELKTAWRKHVLSQIGEPQR